MKYIVAIIETLKMHVEVDAKSPEEAEEKVHDEWRSSKYVLESDSFVGVDFVAKNVGE